MINIGVRKWNERKERKGRRRAKNNIGKGMEKKRCRRGERDGRGRGRRENGVGREKERVAKGGKEGEGG